MVWAAGFEPTASAFQVRRSTKLSYAQTETAPYGAVTVVRVAGSRSACAAYIPRSSVRMQQVNDPTKTTAELVDRSAVMWLIEREIQNWLDTDPLRHALSVLWGKVRDMKDADTVERERMDHEQYQSTVST